MTPKEKAQKLVDIYLLKGYGVIHESFAKQCALIAVDEILKSNPTKINCDSSELNYGYYIEVKKEIELL
jgi:hypothetical protein